MSSRPDWAAIAAEEAALSGRRAHTSLPEGYYQLFEEEQLAVLEPFVADLLGEDGDRG